MEWYELMQLREQDHLASNGYGLKRVASPDGVVGDDVPTFLLSERMVGLWQRTFTLPLDVDMKNLKASLNSGLLSIYLPKRDISAETKVKVEIE
jgi:HSP20 family molecular chaperone IbpA